MTSDPFDELLAHAQGTYRLGRAAARKGLWELALARHSQALGLLQAFGLMVDAGLARLDTEQRRALSALILGLEAACERIIIVSGDGRRANPSGLAYAAKEMLKEIRLLGC